MRKYGYAWEKLFTTVLSLGEGRGSIKQRLEVAWVHCGSRLAYGGEYMPGELKAEYDGIHADLTRVEAKTGGIQATIAAMSEEEASKVAGRIVGLFNKVCEAHYSEAD